MSIWAKISRLMSLIIGLMYAAFLVVPIVAHAKNAAGATLVSIEYCAVIFLPVAMIWFPEQIGAATGFVGYSNVNAETPAFLVSIMGWFFLVGLPLFMYWYR